MLLDDIETEDIALVDESSALSHLDFLTNSHWPRRRLEKLDPNKDSIIFQQFDVSHYKVSLKKNILLYSKHTFIELKS